MLGLDDERAKLISMSRRSARRREDRHHSHVPTAALRAYKPPVLGHIDEDHVIPEPQLLKGLRGLMIAAETMDSELRFAVGSRMADGFRGLAAGH
jgi:hypothetical protein